MRSTRRGEHVEQEEGMQRGSFVFHTLWSVNFKLVTRTGAVGEICDQKVRIYPSIHFLRFRFIKGISLSLSSFFFFLLFTFQFRDTRAGSHTETGEGEKVIERWNHRFRLTRCFSLAILHIPTLFAVKSWSRVINRMGHAAKLTRAHYPAR